LTKLYFDKYSVEVKGLSGEVKQRWRKEDERSFVELFNPNLSDERDLANSELFIIEAYRRLISPWNALSFAAVAVASILVGSFNRKGQTRKIATGSLIIVLMQVLSLVLTNLSKSHVWALPLLYANTIVPVILSIYVLNPAGEKILHEIIVEIKGVINKKHVRGEK